MFFDICIAIISYIYLYCDNCRRIVDREKDIRCKNKKKHKPTFVEITRMADAEGLSYGK